MVERKARRGYGAKPLRLYTLISTLGCVVNEEDVERRSVWKGSQGRKYRMWLPRMENVANGVVLYDKFDGCTLESGFEFRIGACRNASEVHMVLQK
jgi:hypothetical protein